MSDTPTFRPNELLTEHEAAKYIGMSVHYLRRGRHQEPVATRTPTPRYLKVGARHVRYAVEDLDRWIADNIRVVG